MMDEQLRDNVDRLLRGKVQDPSPEFEARVNAIIGSASVSQRKKATLVPLAIAAAGFLGLMVWSTLRNAPSSQDSFPPDRGARQETSVNPPPSAGMQSSEVPWRTDVPAARLAAQREGKPFVLILGVDGGVHLVRNVESSLSAAKDFRELCARVSIAATHRGDPNDKELRESLKLSLQNPWIVVLDAKGEVLGSRFAQPYYTVHYDASQFPGVLSRMIEEILSRPLSVQELERRWKARSLTETQLENLEQRLTEMCAYDKLVEVSEGIIREESWSTHLRDLGRYYFYIGKSSGVSYEENRPRSAVLGERLLLEMKDPAVMEKQAELLWAWGYQSEFDFPAKTREAAKRMGEVTAGRPGEETSKVAIAIFSRSCMKRVEEMEKEFEKLPVGWDHPQAFERATYCAWLGKAKETVEYFSTHSPGFGPQYDRWLNEAREKLAKGQPK